MIEQALAKADADAMAAALEQDPSAAHAVDVNGLSLVARIVGLATTDASIPLIRSEPHAALLEVAIDAGAPLDVQDARGFTALHTAAFCGADDLVKQLLDGGADPQLCCDLHGSALHYALFYGHTDAARHLRLEPPSLREAAGLGDLAALEACWAGDALAPQASARLEFYRPSPGFPEWTLDGTDQQVLDEALTWAARNGQIPCLAKLLDHGANPNANPYRGTAVLWAAYSGRDDAIRWLVEHGADPSLPHDFGGAGHGNQATAMHLAAQFGNIGTLEVLLECGADWSIRDASWNGTPRDWAGGCGADAAAAWLAERGAP